MLVANISFAQTEEIIFYDDFSDNKNNWNVLSDAGNGAEIRGGYYYFQSKQKQSSWYRYNPSVKSIDGNKDFIIEWSVWQVTGGEDWGIGLVCFMDDNGSDAFGAWILPNGQWTYTKTGEASYGWKNTSAVIKGNNVANKVAIKKVGSTVSIIINGQSVHQMNYSPALIKHVAFQTGSEKLIAVDYLKIAYLAGNSTEELVTKYFDEGVAFSNKNENDKAIEKFTEVIKLKPSYALAYNWRGYVYQKKKEYDIAINDQKEAVRLTPDYASYHYFLGQAYYYKKRYDEAIKAYDEAIRLDPKSANYHLWKGYVYSQKKDYDQAINCYNEMIRLDPKNLEAYRSRANIYRTKKEYDKTISEYTQIIQIDPQNASAYYNRSNTYKLQKIYGLALFDINNAIRIDTASYSYIARRGDLFKDMGETGAAIKDYNEYVRLSGKATAYTSRGWFYYDLKKHDLALEDFNTSIKMEPTASAWLNQRGSFYRYTGQLDLALTDFNALIERDQKYIYGYIGRGATRKEKGEYTMAVRDFETAIGIDPNNSNTYTYILSPLIRTGQLDKAKFYADKYIATGSTSLEANDNSRFYKYYVDVVANDIPQQQYGQALVDLDLAIKEYSLHTVDKDDVKSEYIDILALKGFVLEKLNRFKEAGEIYEQALVINNFQPDVKDAIASLKKTTDIIAVNDKTPPEIQLISPSTDRGLQVVAGQSLTQVIGKAKDLSGIASVSVNGKIVTKIEEDGLFVTNISLKQGLNDLVIIATDKKGNTATQSFKLQGNTVAKITEAEIIVPVTTTEKAPQYHAILIAAKDYIDPSIADLENPIKDASELKAILETGYTFNPKNIETLYNKSREEIMQALVLKSNSLTDNDNLLIFYAGHGIAEKDKFGDVDGYWVPSSAKKGINATYISADDINKALKRTNSKHVLVIADACFSGAFTRTLAADASIGIQKQYSVPSRKVMASGNLEPVPDNSRFVYYLKKNLRDNREKYLTAKKLFDSFYEAILNNSDTSPQYAAIKNVGDEGGEFVFIRKQ